MVGGAASVSVSDVEALGLCSVTFGEKGDAMSMAGGTASCFGSDVVVSVPCSTTIDDVADGPDVVVLVPCSTISDDEVDATSLSSANGLAAEDLREDMLDCCAISSG